MADEEMSLNNVPSTESEDGDEIERLIERERKAKEEKDAEQQSRERRDARREQLEIYAEKRSLALRRWAAALLVSVTLLIILAVLILWALLSGIKELDGGIVAVSEEIKKRNASAAQPQPQMGFHIEQWQSEPYISEHPECKNSCRNWSRVIVPFGRSASALSGSYEKRQLSSEDTPMAALRALDRSFVLVIIVGGHDRKPVGHVEGRAFNTNDELAQLRADNIQKELVKSVNEHSQVQFIALPRKNEHEEDHFDDDRTVTVTIVSERSP